MVDNKREKYFMMWKWYEIPMNFSLHEYSFIGTLPYLFISELSMAAFVE